METILRPIFPTQEDRLSEMLTLLLEHYGSDVIAFVQDCSIHSLGETKEEQVRNLYDWVIARLQEYDRLDDLVLS